MIYLKTFEGMNEKYRGISEEEFINLFKENCKNFSFKNDPLYRGDEEVFEFGYHNPIERSTKSITFLDYFAQKEKDLEKYPVLRKNSMFGLGGTDIKSLIRVSSMLASMDDECPSYRVIPFDNSNLVFCPIFDLKMMDSDGEIGTNVQINDDSFIMVEYTENFKVPVKELTKIQKNIFGNTKYTKHGFEFFTSSPCLLIPHQKRRFFKKTNIY